MASSKRIGFFWGEEKITIVEFDKNAPVQIVSSPLGSKSGGSSPFSSNLTEEIQITAILQKMMQDNHIKGGSFYISLPSKEIILRSFIIPFVKQDIIQDAIKFEAKKYMPFDIQELSFVFYTIPFSEGQTKRLQVIFFAARKEILARYERIFKQVNTDVSYCEPYMVSLTKSLLYRKEIKPTDHLAFLSLDKNLGRICFINQGIPQFIREFPVSFPSQTDEPRDPSENLNQKIIDEVGNSFDFYARQFSGDRIEQILVSSDYVQKGLLVDLETELKVKLTKFSPVIMMGPNSQSSDIDAIYAMGACVAPPMDALSGFNFLGSHKQKTFSLGGLSLAHETYKEILYVLAACLAVLVGTYLFFNTQLKIAQHQLDQLSAKQGIFLSEPVDSIKAESQQNIDKLTQLKNIRVKSDVTFLILRLASHLPKGMLLDGFNITYQSGDTTDAHVSIDMRGEVFMNDPNEQIAVVDKLFSDLKQDKELAKYFSNVGLGPLNSENFRGQQVTGFNIHCS